MFADLGVNHSQSAVENQVQRKIIHIADLWGEFLEAHPEQLGKLGERNLNKCALKRERVLIGSLI